MTQGNIQAGSGGNGGGAGGLSRSVLDFTTSDKVHCTINSSISQFGDYLSSTAGSGQNPGIGKGGNEFNTTGNKGGNGGYGGSHSYSNGHISEGSASPGIQGSGNGALGGKAQQTLVPNYTVADYFSGGGGGGGTYNLPPDISYDDPLYTARIKRSISNFKAGDGTLFGTTGGYPGNGSNPKPGQSYPKFDIKNPIWYGGGNGGGGSRAMQNNINHYDGASGSAGSPGGILIEKAVY